MKRQKNHNHLALSKGLIYIYQNLNCTFFEPTRQQNI